MTNENETNEQQDLSETVLWEHDNGIPHTVDDELNMQTGVPHFSMVVDEIEQWANVVQLVSDEPHLHWQGPVSLDNMVGLGTIAYAMEQYGKALERLIIENNALRGGWK